MPGHRVLQRTFVLALAAGSLWATDHAGAQAGAGYAAGRTVAAPPADDIAMPDDMGAPIAGADGPAAASAPESAPRVQSRTLSVDTPIDVIAASPQGKAVLEHELPGLCERPEYIMFRTMSPAKLALLSNGRISQAKLTKLQAHLVKVSMVTPAEPPRHSLLAEGATRVKRLSQSAYRKVLSAIEAL